MKKRLRPRFIWLVVIVLVLIGAGAYLRSWFTSSSSPGGHVAALSTNVPYNILLIGNNARQATGPLSLGTSGGQADILMLVHIDPQQHKVTMISIPRDLLIALPQWRDPVPKIKETLFLGLQEGPAQGPELAMQVVSHFTGMPVKAYIATDFQGFIDAVDAVGCVNIDIPYAIYDPIHSMADFQPGVHCLSGPWVLAFIRVRQNTANSYRTTDFQRMDAEAQVLFALKEKLLHNPVDAALHLPALVATWRKDVATNLSNSQLLSLGLTLAHSHVQHVTLGSIADSMDLASMPLPGINAENQIDGAYYDVLSAADVTKMLKPYGSTGAWTGLPSFPSPKDVPVAVEGSSAYVALLQKKGFPATQSSATSPSARLTVVFPNGQVAAGFAVARALAAANELVTPGSVSEVTVYAP